VRVKVLATVLNPIDGKIQKAGIFVENFPAVIGSDAAGTVDKVGEGVTGFKAGDRVVHEGWYLENDKGTFQQYDIVPAEILAKIPSSMSFEEAATIPLGLATAVVGLYLPLGEAAKSFNPDGNAGIGLTPPWTPEGKNKYAGQPIVILGGSSSVGQFAIQLARLSGFSPIITTSSLKHEANLKSFGATHVIGRDGDTTAEIKKHLPNGTTGVLYDAISTKDTQTLAVAVTTPDALIALTLVPNPEVDFGGRKPIRTFGNFHANRKIGVSLFKALPELLETGAIKPNPVEIVPGGLKGIIDGLEKLSQNKVSGTKLVGQPWE